MKIAFSQNEYSEGVKMRGLTKNFGKFYFLIKSFKNWQVYRRRPVLSHGTLEICLGRLVKVLIALRHFSPGSSLRHFRPGRRY